MTPSSFMSSTVDYRYLHTCRYLSVPRHVIHSQLHLLCLQAVVEIHAQTTAISNFSLKTIPFHALRNKHFTLSSSIEVALALALDLHSTRIIRCSDFDEKEKEEGRFHASSNNAARYSRDATNYEYILRSLILGIVWQFVKRQRDRAPVHQRNRSDFRELRRDLHARPVFRVDPFTVIVTTTRARWRTPKETCATAGKPVPW